MNATAVRVAAPLILGAVAIVVWQLLSGSGVVDDYLLPSPLAILAEIGEFLPSLVGSAIITGSNAFVGLVAGALIGVLGALAASRAGFIDDVVAPIVAGLAVIPIVALAPVLNTMFGADSQFSRQAIAALATFVPVFVNTLRGLRQTRAVHRDLLRVYAASPGQITRNLTLPTARPFIFTGIRIASSLAVISALVAEYFGGPRGGLGGLISTSAASSAYARAWAYVVGSIVLGLLFFVVTSAMERLATPSSSRPSGRAGENPLHNQSKGTT
jgi:NitT/TauT family transport system permease protein